VIGALVAAAAGWLHMRLAAERRLQQRLEEQVARRTAELNQANSRIKEQNQLLEELSRTDPLTELANRRVLAEQLPTEMAVLQREISRLAPTHLAAHHGATLMMIDLDHFKEVNDRWGHEAGDEVLRRISASLAGCLREVDLAVRWGGEEFLVLGRGVDRSGASRLARRLLVAIANTTVTVDGETTCSVTGSIGFLCYPLAVDGLVDPREWRLLVDLADRLMFEAKQRGRARACGLVWLEGARPETSEAEAVSHVLTNPSQPPAGMEFVEIEADTASGV
jgi:diguanylate cyclase (GGDEF)-like protein